VDIRLKRVLSWTDNLDEFLITGHKTYTRYPYGRFKLATVALEASPPEETTIHHDTRSRRSLTYMASDGRKRGD
jgi:hypothetical protein